MNTCKGFFFAGWVNDKLTDEWKTKKNKGRFFQNGTFSKKTEHKTETKKPK